MLKLLIKKEIDQSILKFLHNPDKKKRNLTIIGLVALVLYFQGIFYLVFSENAKLDIPDSNYYLMAIMVSFTLALFVGIFTTKAYIYEAKDNDLMFSLPIKNNDILLSRIFVSYIQIVLYIALLYTVAIVAKILVGNFNFLLLINHLFVILGLGVLALILSLIVAGLIALLIKIVNNKMAVEYFFYIVFLIIYVTTYTKFTNTANVIALTKDIIKLMDSPNIFLMPFLSLAKASGGDFVSLIIYLLVSILIFGLIFKLLEKNFFELSNTKISVKKKKYRLDRSRNNSFVAFIKKEFNFLFSNPLYLMNAAIGTIFSVIALVYMVIKRQDIIYILSDDFMYQFREVVLLGASLFLASINFINACSISLEGKYFNVLRSFPFNTKDIFLAKISVHFIMTFIPILLLDIVAFFMFDISILNILFIIFASVLMVYLYASLDLLINLIFPKLDYDNPIKVIKQSLASFISMISNLGLAVGIIFLYVKLYLDYFDFSSLILLIILVVLNLGISLCLFKYGKAKFNQL